MILDYNPSQSQFILRVARGETPEPRKLMREHGWDWSSVASTRAEAVLFNPSAFAAAEFAHHATFEAQLELAPLLEQIRQSWAADSPNSYSSAVPYGKELWPFQRADLDYALQRRNTLIGDQPGLGKTEVAIAFANEIKAKSITVVCPANIRQQWATRIDEWSTTPKGNRNVRVVRKSTDGIQAPTRGKQIWNIVSYDLCRGKSIGAALSSKLWPQDLLILDEPHFLKEVTTQRTRAIFGGGAVRHFDPIADNAARILGLTGTPLPNRPREAYTLCRGLCWDSIDWLSEDKFRQRYNPTVRKTNPTNGKMYIDERTGRHGELMARLRGTFMVRHLKHGPYGVMKQLQMPIYDLIQVGETEAVKSALKAESLLDIDPDSLEGADADILGQVATARRLMGEALAPQVAEYISDLVDSGEEKLTVFAWHHSVLNILEAALERHGVLRIDGNTSPGAKQANVDEFIANPNIRVIIGNMLSMGIGTDGLQLVCNHGLIAEPDWVIGNNMQAFDRLDRGGQRQQVQADIFVAPGSIAERILAKALKKGQIVHQILDGGLDVYRDC